MRAGLAFAAALSLFTHVSHAVPDSYTLLSPVSTDSSWVFDVPEDGLLQFESLLVPLGVSAAFQGDSSQISLFARNEIRIDGSLNVGSRSLSLNAPRITFGPQYFLTGSGSRLDINTTAFDGGANFNPRGEVYLNGQRVATGGTLPGETFGLVWTQQIDFPVVVINVDPQPIYYTVEYQTPVLQEFLLINVQIQRVSEPPMTVAAVLVGLSMLLLRGRRSSRK